MFWHKKKQETVSTTPRFVFNSNEVQAYLNKNPELRMMWQEIERVLANFQDRIDKLERR